jgi:HSP20 family protein
MALLPFRKDMPVTLGDVQNEVNRLFERLWHGGITTGPLDGQDWAPPLDVLDDQDRYVIRAEVPGLDVKDIEVSVSGDTLTLQGHKPAERREGDERKYILMERRYGGFNRSIPLPVGVDASGVTATCRKGVLEIVLPKKEENKPKPIRVEVTD